jgi:hypothetical protein
VAPGGVDKEPAPGDASAAFEAPNLQPAMPGHEPQQEAPSATDVQQADAHTQKLAAVPDAPDVQPGEEPAPVDAASAAADAQMLQAGKPESEPQPAREAPTATDVKQAAQLAAVPDAPDVQLGGVDKEPAPVEVSAAADAPKLQPAMSESVPRQAREAPSATNEQPQ